MPAGGLLVGFEEAVCIVRFHPDPDVHVFGITRMAMIGNRVAAHHQVADIMPV